MRSHWEGGTYWIPQCGAGGVALLVPMGSHREGGACWIPRFGVGGGALVAPMGSHWKGGTYHIGYLDLVWDVSTLGSYGDALEGTS